MRACAASALDFAAPGAPEPPRGFLTDLRDADLVMKGEAPILTVRLTGFNDGTSALGICLSHALCDGYGAYTLLLILARAIRIKSEEGLRRLLSEVQRHGYTMGRDSLKALSVTANICQGDRGGRARGVGSEVQREKDR